MFGYETPLDFKANEAEGTDFESFAFFKIRAASSQAALQWGRALSDWYVQRLFNDPQPGRWSRGGYAAWIETSSDFPVEAGRMSAIPDGEYPDFVTMRSLFTGQG
jgi:hypothetical protein